MWGQFESNTVPVKTSKPAYRNAVGALVLLCVVGAPFVKNSHLKDLSSLDNTLWMEMSSGLGPTINAFGRQVLDSVRRESSQVRHGVYEKSSKYLM